VAADLTILNGRQGWPVAAIIASMVKRRTLPQPAHRPGGRSNLPLYVFLKNRGPLGRVADHLAERFDGKSGRNHITPGRKEIKAKCKSG
jgi:hypothetical protein